MLKTFPAKLEELFFDPNNPRLIGDFDEDAPEKIFRYLITDVGVEDLLESLSASGLFDADPIIVRDKPGGGYYVIEGNRRLAALKLLVGQRPDDGLPIPAIPQVSADISKTFNPIKVQSGWTPELLQAYLGYKHVTSSREWSPEAKAKFVFTHSGGNFSTETLRKFAKSLGTKFPTLKRWLIAYLTLKQAEKAGIFDPDTAPSKGYFGTFYTLLGGLQAREFLNLQDDPIAKDPVPGDRLIPLAEFIKWTIGTKESPAVVNSRQQKKFEQVLGSPRALAHFRVKRDLESSLLYTEYNAAEIAAKFREAAYNIEECLAKLNDVRENAAVQEAFAEFERAYQKAKLNMAAAPEPSGKK
jgi:hypothetical protein